MTRLRDYTLEAQHGYDHAGKPLNASCHGPMTARAWRYGEGLKLTGLARPKLVKYDVELDYFLSDEEINVGFVL